MLDNNEDERLDDEHPTLFHILQMKKDGRNALFVGYRTTTDASITHQLA